MYILSSIVIIGVVTFILRALPFSLGKVLSNNSFVSYVALRLPLILMFTLTVYASGAPSAQSISEVAPQVVALCITAAFHLSLNNYLVSIFFGVISYMFLIDVV